MFIGVWADGEFVDGKWVHQDGTSFQGSFEASVPVSRLSRQIAAVVLSGVAMRETLERAVCPEHAVLVCSHYCCASVCAERRLL